MEAWVTSAMEGREVNKAILLACSLRQVYTGKNLVVLAGSNLHQEMMEKLGDVFDLVIPIAREAPGVLKLEDFAKVEAFSLLAFNKCVYLSPSTVVLKNCDEIFDKYSNFAICEDEEGSVDSSVYLFTPSMEHRRSLWKFVETWELGMSANTGFTSKPGEFEKCFKLWIQNNIPNWEKLDGSYNAPLNLKNKKGRISLRSTPAIANFSELHPMDFGECGDEEIKGVLGQIVNPCSSGPLYPQVGDYKKEPIAIIGMSCRLPGGNTVDEFWDLLINGKEAIIPLPDSRWTREQTQMPCQNRKVEGGFLSIPVDEFEPKFFGISGKEAEVMDPQHRLLHEVAWEALEEAMVDPLSLRDTRTGIFVGSWLQDYRDMLMGTTDADFFRNYMGNSIASGAGRLSHFFETTGPSIGIESGCSSSMVAVDMACKSLRNRESNLALACGVNLLLKPFDHNTMSFVVSPDGRCKTFDQGANGYGRAEGCAVLLLKRLSDALRDQDNIWGLIRGSAITQEGVSKSFGTPTVHCESLAMKLALSDAQVDPLDVSFVEAHGTGTAVGDPLEIGAITEAYSKAGRAEPLLIGSVKTNVGHTESVSGITGIIKVLLSMRNEKIPPHLNLKRLNPAINLGAIPANIPLEAAPWPRTGVKPRLAGVNSFGLAGSDGHVIIQEPPSSWNAISHRTHPNDIQQRPLHIMKISAKSEESLHSLLTTFENIFSLKGHNEADEFADMAYSANIGRATFTHRAVIIAKDYTDATDVIRNKSFRKAEVQPSQGQGKLCFLFTGQGSQYPNMGATLYATSPIFKDAFDKCDDILSNRYGINLRQVLWGQGTDASATEVSRTLYSQTGIFCIEYCLLKLWESWGVKPDYVVGHSLGEVAAAVAAGALNIEDALMLVTERSQLVDALPTGKMLVIRADHETVAQQVAKCQQLDPSFWVDYAAINSQDQTVVAGDSGMIDEFAAYCRENSLKATVLAASHAFHSRHMDPTLEEIRRLAERIKPLQPGKDAPKYISGMEGKLIDSRSIDVDYWVRHTREPVHFLGATKALQADGCYLFLELGPHPVLSALTMMNYESKMVTCLPSIRRKEDDWATILDSLAKLFVSDWKGQVDWKGFDCYYERSRVPLPFYPFNRKRVWKDMEGSLPRVHPLVGRPIPIQGDQTVFENKLTLRNTPFVRDHVIGNTVVFPGAAFLEMCLVAGHAAAIQLGANSRDRGNPQGPIALKSFKILSPLGMDDSGIYKLQSTAKLDMEGNNDNDELGYCIGIHRYMTSTSDVVGQWITQATGKYLPLPKIISKNITVPTHIDIPGIQTTWEETDSTEFYERLSGLGLSYGPKFRSLDAGWKSEDGLLFEVRTPKEEASDGGYLTHPITSDAMIQAIMMLGNLGKNWTEMKLQVPVGIEEFVWLQASTSTSRYVYCWRNDEGKICSILLDEGGSPLARMTGVDFIETSVKRMQAMMEQHDAVMPKLWREVWKSAPGPLESAYDLTTPGTSFPEFGEQQRQRLTELNDIGEEEASFHRNLCNLARLFFLNALYELGWEPKQGVPFTLEELLHLLPESKEQFKRYIRFLLKSLSESGMLMDDGGVEDSYCFIGLPPTQDAIKRGLEQVSGPEDHSRIEYKLGIEAGRNLRHVWLGNVDPLQIIFPGSPAKPSAAQFYNSVAIRILPVLNEVNDVLFTELFDKYYNPSRETSHGGRACPPVLRVLEVGAGTGGYSAPFLERLGRWGKPYKFYFTDISASFFNAAENRFQDQSKSMVFKVFNMEEDPLAQGFCPGYFDLILASEVLHVAKDIRKTLRNLGGLLKPGGLFQFFETTVPDLRMTQMFGILEGYWRFEDSSLRPYHATLTPAKWEQVLEEVGCERVICTPVYDSTYSLITARLSADGTHKASLDTPERISWLIFYHDYSEDIAEALGQKLMEGNRKVHRVKRPPNCTENVIKDLMTTEFQSALKKVTSLEGVIYLWGLPNGATHRNQSEISLPLINLVQTMMNCRIPPRLYAVTQGAANTSGYDVTNPAAGTLHGIIKSLSNENPSLQLRCLDLSPEDPALSQVDSIFHELWTSMEGSGSILAFREQVRLCSKLVPAKVTNNEPLPLPNGCHRFQLVLPATKAISDLEFAPLENYELEGVEIEVEVKATALNFRDVFAVLKPTTQFEKLNAVGLDFSGVITKLGSKVTNRQVGDRVIGMNMDNNLSLSSHIKLDGQLAVSIPPSLTFAEGATLPLVFATAYHCLINVARMKRGDTVLIHTASGGVGLCAIKLARGIGANVIATAGSSRKQNYLRNLGIQHIFQSRTTQFGKDILELTNGRGVDIVLNSITGEGFKEASLSALAKNGRFIEMSKLNVWTPEEVNAMRPDVFYQIVDLMTVHKSQIAELMNQLGDDLNADIISPIASERFDALNIRGALNHLQKANHIGKVVCMMPEISIANSKIEVTTPLFNNIGTYIVTGGLGGIGFEVVKWMLSSGAKHIAIVSRNKPKPEIEDQLQSWNNRGCHIEAFAVDIGDMEQCRGLFDKLESPKSAFPQVRGIIHAAGVLADGTIANQDWSKFKYTYKAKVDGTWNLHDISKHLLLEHFVLFSSTAASIGSPGQSNHSSSNSFEDALASYRRSNGLPATSINWGIWGEVGIATEAEFPGVRPITTSQGMLALETFLRTQESHLTVANIESFALAAKLFPSLKTSLEDKRLFGETKKAATTVITGDGFWKKLDSTEDRHGKLLIFKDVIKSVLRNILKMDQDEVLNDNTDFQTLGVDSLMTLEMRNGVQNILGSRMTLTASQLKNCSNTSVLADLLMNVLEGKGE